MRGPEQTNSVGFGPHFCRESGIFYQGAKEQALKSPAPVLVLGTGGFVVAGVLPEITHGFISALGLQAR